MNQRLPGLKFSLFALVCLAFTAWLVVTIGNISFSPRTSYAASFDNVQGLLVNDDVKISGVTVGRVDLIEHEPGGRVRVSFSVDDDIALGEDTELSVRWRNLLGLRFLYLEPGGEGSPVAADHVFPREQTRAPADLGSLLQRLTPFIEALDPQLQNQVLESLSTALVGREDEVRDLIRQGGELTTTIATRDAEIESLLQNSATVLEAYAAREDQLRGLLDSFADVADTVAGRTDEVESAIVSLADGQEELRRLVDANDDEVRATIDALEAITDVLAEDRDRFETILETTPRGLIGYHLISGTGQWFNIRAVGVSLDSVVLTTERGASYPREPGRASTGIALNELLGGGLG
ncbi:MCE family protein [Nitriliruptoraceae bacterium ZYF776]|nr:MCE family protein [Profundirhabdus halotolerans]